MLTSCLWTAGVGKIKTRDEARLWNSDQEHKMRLPDDPFYKRYAAECSRVQIAVDVFSFRCYSHVVECIFRLGD